MRRVFQERVATTPRWTDNKFRCPVCDGSDEEDLPFRGTEETEGINEILQELNRISTI